MLGHSAKRVRTNDEPLSLENRFRQELASLPPILSTDEFLKRITGTTLSAYNCMIQFPQSYEHLVVDEVFGVHSLGRTPLITYEGHKLIPAKCEELLVRTYARERACSSVVQVKDGYIGIPRFRIHRGKLWMNSRTMPLKVNPVVEALIEVAMTAVSDNTGEGRIFSTSELQLLLGSLTGMYSLTKPEDLARMSAALASLKDMDIGALGSESLDHLQGKSRSLYDTILGIKLNSVPLEDLVTILMASTSLATPTKLQLFAMHPQAALPFLQRKADAYDCNGNKMISVKLRDVGDEDLVQCTAVYITSSALSNISLNSQVYVGAQVFSSVGKARGGVTKLAGTASTDRTMTGRSVKVIASLNTVNETEKPPNDVVDSGEDESQLPEL